MAFFEHTDKSLENPANLKSKKTLNKILGSDFLLKPIRKLAPHELGNFRMGSLFLTMVFTGIGYYFYRQAYKQKMITSYYYYRLLNARALNAGNQFWWNARDSEDTDLYTYYYRMPKKEFDVKYRMKSAFIQGEFDHDKEILIPHKQNGAEGYQVITPFYYYSRLNPSNFVGLLQDGSPFDGSTSQRAAMAVYRGW